MRIPDDPCPTVGCTSEEYASGFGYDHLGQTQCWCPKHTSELIGVRERITALLAQIEGLKRVLDVVPFDPGTPAARMRFDATATLREQGALLVQLIKRERELTGAGKAKGDG